MSHLRSRGLTFSRANRPARDLSHTHPVLACKTLPTPRRDTAMHTYSEVLELAIMSARNARLASTKQAAQELWQIAQEYQAEAAKLGEVPDIGDPPQGLED